MVVMLDSGPLGLLALPSQHPTALPCHLGFHILVESGIPFAVPEIIDYELRRELLRLGTTQSVCQLDILLDSPDVACHPISTREMRLVAHPWAEARRDGKPTADLHALDADVILAAQTQLLSKSRCRIPPLHTEPSTRQGAFTCTSIVIGPSDKISRYVWQSKRRRTRSSSSPSTAPPRSANT